MNFYDLDPERQQAASLQRFLRYLREDVARYHPYLRRLYRERGIRLEGLKTRADLLALPMIRKDELRDHPALFVLQPKAPGAPPLPEGYDTEPLKASMIAKFAWRAALNHPRDHSQKVRHPTFREKIKRRGQHEWFPIHYHASTGSTGEPTPVTFTRDDVHRRVAEMASLIIQHKQPGPDYVPYDWSERAMSLMPAAPHVAFYAAVLAKLTVGAASFETFGGAVIPTDRQVALFAKGGFSNILAIPSYMTHWLRRARALQDENKAGPLSGLRRLVLGAEPISNGLREYIRKLALDAGADPKIQIYQSYAMTEFKWVFTECAEGSGVHLNPKHYYWELLHPETLQPVGPGEPGVLVFSHVGWRGTVLIRYWTGDLVKGGMRWDRCEHCGYTFPRIFAPICRADKDFTKIKGARVDLSLMIETVRDTPGVRRFQIVLENESAKDEFSRDMVTVHVVKEPKTGRSELEGAVKQRLKSLTEVSPDRVIFVDDEAAFETLLFARNGVKADYLDDRRKHAL